MAGGARIQGILAAGTWRLFEQHRKELAREFKRIVGRKPSNVSDTDVVAYLVHPLEEVRSMLTEQYMFPGK